VYIDRVRALERPLLNTREYMARAEAKKD
jgi:hypothetical protein